MERHKLVVDFGLKPRDIAVPPFFLGGFGVEERDFSFNLSLGDFESPPFVFDQKTKI